MTGYQGRRHIGTVLVIEFGLQPSCLYGSRVLAVVLSSIGVSARCLLLSSACSRRVHVIVGYQPSYRRRIGAVQPLY